MTDWIVVLCTCGSAEEAERLGRALVESRLAACVNILPGVRSLYRWQGALESSDEFLLIIKSSRELFEALRAEIERLHSYEVPEIVALPVTAVAQKYLGWMMANLGPESGG
jgi:periplasmic divalent cation tolerance protein